MADTLTVVTEPLENREVRLTVAVPDAIATPVLRKIARRIASETRIPGFRPGKAPYEVIVRRFGREALVHEALEELIDQVYEDALQESQIEPGGMPSLDNYAADPLSLTFRVPLRPVVELGDYHELRVPFEEPDVTDEEVDKLVQDLRAERTSWVPVERAAQFGDLVTVDLLGEIDGEQTIKQESWDLELTETGEALVPGLDAAFVGMTAGESKSFTLTYPADSTSQWAGKTANFEAMLHTVKAELVPSDDVLAAEAGNFAGMQQLRSHLEANLALERQEAAERGYRSAVVDALVDHAVKIDYPASLVDDELKRVVDEQEAYYRDMGLDMESFLRYTNQTMEGMQAQLRPAAERRLKQRLVIAELARAEGVHLHEEDLDAEIERVAFELPVGEADEYRDLLHTPGGQMYLIETLTNRLTIDRLVAIAQGKTLEPFVHAVDDEMTEEEALALNATIGGPAEEPDWTEEETERIETSTVEKDN